MSRRSLDHRVMVYSEGYGPGREGYGQGGWINQAIVIYNLMRIKQRTIRVAKGETPLLGKR